MKYRFAFIVLSLALLFAIPNVSHAQVEDFSPKYLNSFAYSDSEADISFNVPDNWEQEPLTAEREVVKAKFSSPDKAALIIYGSYDIWAQLSTSEKQGLTRSSIDNSYVSIDDLAEIYSIPKTSIELETFAGNEFYLFPYSLSIDSTSVSLDSSSIQAICFNNGFMIQFQFYGEENGKNYDDFLALLSSATFPNVGLATTSYSKTTNSQQSNFSLDFGTIILNLVITIALYSLPIMVYRYAIRKQPCDKRTAKKITIIYAIVIFIIVSFLYFLMNANQTASVSAVVVWSYVNYRILIANKKQNEDITSSETTGELPNSKGISSVIVSDKTDILLDVLSSDNNVPEKLIEDEVANKHSNTDESETHQINNAPTNDADDTDLPRTEPNDQSVKTFCHMCGNQLPRYAKFCNRCGAKLIDLSEEN